MKKYNLMIAASLLVYLVFALTAGWGIRRIATGKETAYKVEINRVYDSLSQGNAPDKLDLRSYEYLENVRYLPADALTQEDNTTEFYEAGNRLGVEIRPVFANGGLAGFLRFEYQEPEVSVEPIWMLTQICLGLLEIFFTALLFYLKYRVMKPFLRLQNLPYELANGHFKGIVKEEKNQYFVQFLRGMGQLKDTLDIAKKRQLELEMEKKKMLLSLSHDIKTPLHTIRLYGKALEENLYKDEGKRVHAAHQIGIKTAEIERYVEEIMKNSRENILDIQVKEEEFYMSELMKKVLDTYKEKCRLHLLDLSVGNYENFLLKGDLERSMEVFENIFENAFKYGDGRKIEITFYEEDYCHLIRIYNTGTPVTDNDFNHIFESFFRAANSTGLQGHGLGLYICREIMQKMGGEIFAQKDEAGMAFVLVFR